MPQKVEQPTTMTPEECAVIWERPVDGFAVASQYARRATAHEAEATGGNHQAAAKALRLAAHSEATTVV